MYTNEGKTIFLILLFFCLVTIYLKIGVGKNKKIGTAQRIFLSERLSIER